MAIKRVFSSAVTCANCGRGAVGAERNSKFTLLEPNHFQVGTQQRQALHLQSKYLKVPARVERNSVVGQD